MKNYLKKDVQDGESNYSIDIEKLEKDLALANLKSENETPGESDGIDCKLCMNRGYIYELRDGKLWKVPCKCQKKRESIRIMKKSGLGDMLEKYTFKNFDAKEDWQKEALAKARIFYKHLEDNWFVMCGNPGSGKTHFCTALCGQLLKDGKELRYMRWIDDGGRIKAVINDNYEYELRVKPLKEVQVLYIDDFLKSPKDTRTGEYKITSGDIRLALSILDYRYQHSELSTIISTELSIPQILDIDEALGSRIYERSVRTSVSIVGKDKNWRLNDMEE